MRIGKVVFIVLTVFAVRIFISCCDCPVTTTFMYSFGHISVYNLDNSGKELVISQSNSIPKRAYGIRIDLSLLKLSSNTFRLNAFTDARAFDCFCPPETQYTPKDTITSISVTTDIAFNNQYPAESDVSDLFRVLGSGRYITIGEHLKSPEAIYENTTPDDEKIELFLLQPPDNAGEYLFKVEVFLSDGRILSMTADPVNLE